MPATEKTWRDQTWMHIVFGVSSLLMLLATIWLMQKNHDREWRAWQLKERGKEAWTLNARLVEAEATSQVSLQKLKSALAQEKATPIDPAAGERFGQIVLAEDDRLAEQGIKTDQEDLEGLNELVAELNTLAAEAEAAATVVEPAQKAAQEALAAQLEAEGGDVQDEELKALRQQAKATLNELEQAKKELRQAEATAAAKREDLLDGMGSIISEAKRREDALMVQKKFTAAKHTAKVSELGIAVNEGALKAEIDEMQLVVDELAGKIAELDAEVTAAKDYRLNLSSISKKVQASASAVQKELDAVHTDLGRIAENRDKNTWNVREWITRWPILNALYDGNIRPEQIWLPDMKINYNFSHVARYDRCTTCHRSIDKTAAGSAVEPAYPPLSEEERHQKLSLSTPESRPQDEVSTDGERQVPSLQSVYGFALAPRGQVDRYAITVQYVLPQTPAAEAGLVMGDVIESIDGISIESADELEDYLLENVEWGESLEVSIERGLSQPYTSHPRLDLFVGSMSPHKRQDMGCTICHDGQGSATDFKWASHTPNNPDQALEWQREYGWFDNHHWIFPMPADRFVESNCLKCHHEVAELEPTERFPEPPAPKLVEGFHLIQDYGCFGCHEINGYDGPDKRIGPDMRLEPNYHEVAATLLSDSGLTEAEREMASTVIGSPDVSSVRNELYASILRDADNAEDPAADEPSRLTANSHKLADLLKDVDAPGKLRKSGPSLRYVGSKVDYDWLYSWIRQPSDFRPSTKMPQFFGLHEHLEAHEKEFSDFDGNATSMTDKARTEAFEQIEIRALVEFLLRNSSEFAYIDPPEGITEEPSAERGEWLFQSRGCLACHSHEKFDGIAANQGPDLSRIAAKFNSGKGERWLYSWIKEPHKYHARTVMPNLYLDPIAETDQQGEPTGSVTDPAADILAYLLRVETAWQPENVPTRELSAQDEKVLAALTAEWLSSAFPKRRAQRYAMDGIPREQGAGIKGDEQVLVGMTAADRIPKQMEYVARRTIGRYGCYGCHDIPGFEAAKPIGTALAEWGRKESSKLAFENISSFLATHGIDGELEHDEHHGDEEHTSGGHHGLDPMDYDEDTGYYLQAMGGHHRPGFVWQKLRMPRSYDYKKTRNKRYDERLRMPKFPLDADQREAVITFVLGLVNEAPDQKYVYQPDARMDAIVQGRHVLEKYNCQGCHVLDMEQWDFAVEPDWFDDPPVMTEFPFLQASAPKKKLVESMEPNNRGLVVATVHGLPVYDEEKGGPVVVDEDGVPIEEDDDESDPYYDFTLYRDAIVAGAFRPSGLQTLLIPAKRGEYGPANGHAYPTRGGDLAKYLYPHAIAEEKKSNPQVKGSEAWGWLPPPLVGEGAKVQTDWLHGFLLEPTKLRPAAVMRMPNFHMSSDDASKLVNYFAAKDNADWPYEHNTRRTSDYLADKDAAYPAHLDDAMKIVTNGNYCVKCHAVGDYAPKGAIKTQGPQLAEVYKRLRPEYLRDWIANPKRILPYTGMPVNVPYPDGVSQDLYHGTAIEQIDGLVDLLLNFDEYARRGTTIKDMVQEAPPEDGGQAEKTKQPLPDQSAFNE